MYRQNIIFQEEYKRLDALCRDMFSTGEGVSAYIRAMETASYADRRFCTDWDGVYRQLKHFRWMRNQLAHEVGTLEEEFCTDADIAWIQAFHRRLLDREDPLAVANRAKTAPKTPAGVQEPASVSRAAASRRESMDGGKKRISLFGRLAAKLRKLFFG